MQRVWLDFEKPIAEIDQKLKVLKEKAAKSKTKEPFVQKIEELTKELTQVQSEIYSKLTPWQKVKLARHPNRPYTLDYIKLIFKDFIELHGDRKYRDDSAIICGLAKIDNKSVVVIGHQKGKDMRENLKRNFGMPHPEGYWKALRIMKLAEKFSFPVITMLDTPGAYPGIGAEERGIGLTIARNLKQMALLKTPIIGVVIGEGGSGGALGIGLVDILLMMKNAYYSVISPEGASAILWRDAAKAPDAAKALKLTAEDLLELGIVDEIIDEPLGSAHIDPEGAANNLAEALRKYLKILENTPIDELLNKRYLKYRKLGAWKENSTLR